jgi:hypothetical protein
MLSGCDEPAPAERTSATFDRLVASARAPSRRHPVSWGARVTPDLWIVAVIGETIQAESEPLGETDRHRHKSRESNLGPKYSWAHRGESCNPHRSQANISRTYQLELANTSIRSNRISLLHCGHKGTTGRCIFASYGIETAASIKQATNTPAKRRAVTRMVPRSSTSSPKVISILRINVCSSD